MELDLLRDVYAIARLAPDAPIPEWADGGEFASITRTPDELSVVCAHVPASVTCQREWRCLKVRGPLDFSLTGVLASIAAPLAAAQVPIFAVSTYETDFILVPEDRVGDAVAALTREGHIVGGGPPGPHAIP
jgi:hypothetical protein